MILIFNEEDLRPDIKDKSIRNINVMCFRLVERQTLMSADLILYVDTKDEVLRILKHRYISDYSGIFPVSDMSEILTDYMNRTNKLGKSTLIPGTNKKR
jgi:hypothetical protein